MNTIFKRISIALIVVTLVIVAILLYRHFVATRALPEGLIQANGRVEGDRMTLASKFPGRIAEIFVHEGDSVKAGQVLVIMDDVQVKAKVTQAQAAVAALDAQVTSAEMQLETLRKAVPLSVESADTGVGQSQALINKATAAQEQSHRDAQRFRELFERGTVSKQRAELAELGESASTADLTVAQQGSTRAYKQRAESRLGYDKNKITVAQLDVVKAQREQAKAALAEVSSVLEDLTLRAASEGIIMTRVRETGEIVAAGSPILDIINLDKLYLKVYVPELDIGKVKLGSSARIYTDAFPDIAFPATVHTIASRAEFTPKEVQTPDERVKLTYAVKLYLDSNPQHQLTPGLPADAVIRWNDNVVWAKPRW